MHSPFHTVMTTPVLDVRGLARMMRQHSARARRDAGPGCEDAEEDAVVLGKLLLLDELACSMWSEGMTATETADLRAAENKLGRAVEDLTARIVEASKVGGHADASDAADTEGGGEG